MLISNVLMEGIYWLLLLIDGIVYTFIDWVYQIIMILAEGNILNNNDIVSQLVNRIYLIIGVIVLFLVAYSLLRAMVNPDEALKGKESPIKIIQNVIISIALVAFIPTIFDFALGFQESLLQQNTLGRLILGPSYTVDDVPIYESNDLLSKGGFEMGKTVLTAFFHPNYALGYCSEAFPVTGVDCKEEVTMSEGWISDIASWNNQKLDEWWEKEIETPRNFLNLTQANKTVANGTISYTPIISTACGILVVVVLLSYCVNIAIRLVKLAVLELIAPLPILARIIPKEEVKKVFNNWLKTTLSTYLELFIRLGILYFIIFIIRLITDNWSSIFSINGGNPVLSLIAQAFVIVGVFLFAKDLPNIIKEITGLDSGKYGIFNGAKQALSALGAGGALVTGAVRGFTNTEGKGFMSGINRFKNAVAGGTKSFASAAKKDYKNWGDVRNNAHSSVEEVINKQRQRQADKDAKKRDLNMYMQQPQGSNEPDFIYKARQNPITGKVIKSVSDGIKSMGEWAGISGTDPIKDARVKEAGSAIVSLTDVIDDIHKKDAGYIKQQEQLGALKANAHGNVDTYLNHIKSRVKELQRANANLTAQDARTIAMNEVSQDSSLQNRFNISDIVRFDQEMIDVMEQQRRIDNLEMQIKAKKAPKIEGLLKQYQATQEKYADMPELVGQVDQTLKSMLETKNADGISLFREALERGDPQAYSMLEKAVKQSDIINNTLADVKAREIERSSAQKKDKK